MGSQIASTSLALLAGLLCLAAPAVGQTAPDFHAAHAEPSPRIDGDLSDAVWQAPPLDLGDWVSYNPLRGDRTGDRTEVRIAYDERNLYFAFHCIDSDVSRIRTTLSRRDDVFNDDWVGLSLDSTGGKQTAYHLMVNPSGVQMDAVNTTSSGERFETDLVWESAGKRTADGYAVEIAMPLQSIRFTNGQAVRMGILFWRHVSRSGVSYSWPELPPGQWVFDRHAHVLFDELNQRRLVELIPSSTLPLRQSRHTPDQWDPIQGKPEFGLSAKFGITSNVTLDATINPDFSQVESDAFQVQVNQRFPVFFSEKRPFFMEGIGLFNVAGTGDGNMRSAVHTRHIVDPSWGTKLTGSSGNLTFGLLSASDETPENSGGPGDPRSDASKLFTLGRATYAIGTSNYAGVIFTDTVQAGRRNQVTGADTVIKYTPRQQLTATYLFSRTTIAGDPDSSGAAQQISYQYDSRRIFVTTQAEHYDRAFQMDTAFYNRTGFTRGWLYGEVNVYPNAGNKAGLVRLRPFIYSHYGHDDVQQGYEGAFRMGMRFHFVRQGFLNVEHTRSYEPWLGQRYDSSGTINSYGNVQLFRWLHVSGYFNRGRSPYYDPITPFQGRTSSGGTDGTWQPNEHFSQSVGYDTVRFRRADTGASVFKVHIVNTKSVYQFDRHFLVRLIEQFDSSQRRLLTDLLGSYEFVPGTVAQAGYGSIAEKPGFDDSRFAAGPDRYRTVSRGLFFKASYLHRF